MHNNLIIHKIGTRIQSQLYNLQCKNLILINYSKYTILMNIFKLIDGVYILLKI